MSEQVPQEGYNPHSPETPPRKHVTRLHLGSGVLGAVTAAVEFAREDTDSSVISGAPTSKGSNQVITQDLASDNSRFSPEESSDIDDPGTVSVDFDPREDAFEDTQVERRHSASAIPESVLSGMTLPELDVGFDGHVSVCLDTSPNEREKGDVEDENLEELLDLLTSESYYVPWISEVFHPLQLFPFSLQCIIGPYSQSSY